MQVESEPRLKFEKHFSALDQTKVQQKAVEVLGNNGIDTAGKTATQIIEKAYEICPISMAIGENALIYEETITYPLQEQQRVALPEVFKKLSALCYCEMAVDGLTVLVGAALIKCTERHSAKWTRLASDILRTEGKQQLRPDYFAEALRAYWTQNNLQHVKITVENQTLSPETSPRNVLSQPTPLISNQDHASTTPGGSSRTTLRLTAGQDTRPRLDPGLEPSQQRRRIELSLDHFFVPGGQSLTTKFPNMDTVSRCNDPVVLQQLCCVLYDYAKERDATATALDQGLKGVQINLSAAFSKLDDTQQMLGTAAVLFQRTSSRVGILVNPQLRQEIEPEETNAEADSSALPLLLQKIKIKTITNDQLTSYIWRLENTEYTEGWAEKYYFFKAELPLMYGCGAGLGYDKVVQKFKNSVRKVTCVQKVSRRQLAQTFKGEQIKQLPTSNGSILFPLSAIKEALQDASGGWVNDELYDLWCPSMTDLAVVISEDAWGTSTTTWPTTHNNDDAMQT